MTLPDNTGPKLVRDDHGRVVAGTLNPRGRPAGSRSRASLAAKRLIGENAEKLVQTAIDAALRCKDQGDVLMLRTLLNKLVPDAKEQRLNLSSLPELAKRGDVVGASKVAYKLLTAGEISPAEFRLIIETLEKLYEQLDRARGDAMYAIGED